MTSKLPPCAEIEGSNIREVHSLDTVRGESLTKHHAATHKTKSAKAKKEEAPKS